MLNESDVECGRRLVLNLRNACHDANSPIVPTPIAEAIRALVVWAEKGKENERE